MARTRGLDPDACLVLWCDRAETDLWTRVALWPDCIGLIFDSIGPLTHDVWDAGLVLNVIAGHDPRDSTSVDVPVPDYGHAISRERLDGVRLGIPAEYFAEGMDPGVEKAVVTAIAHLQALGAQVEEVSLPHTDYAISIYYLILTAEASSNLARFDGIRFGLSEPPEGSDIIQRYLRPVVRGLGQR